MNVGTTEAGGGDAPPVLDFSGRGFAGDSSAGEGTLSVDLDRLRDTRLLIQAESGGGKSWAVRYLCEQTFGRLPHLLFDLEGEFASLREEFPYVLVSATPGEGDLPADPRSARVLARRLCELRASAILDVFDLDAPEQQRFVAEFTAELLALPRSLWEPRLVIVDEAERLAPEGRAAESKDAVGSLVKRARKRRIGVALAVQRLSDLDKGAAGGLQNQLIGLTTLDTDVKRAGDALGFDRARRAALKELEPGTFFAHGPAIPVRGVVLVRTGPVATTHAADISEDEDAGAPPPAPEALADVLRQLAEDLSEGAGDDEQADGAGPAADGDLVARLGELERAYAEQVEHTDFVRTEYQRRVGELERELEEARRESEAPNAELEQRVSDLQEAAEEALGHAAAAVATLRGISRSPFKRSVPEPEAESAPEPTPGPSASRPAPESPTVAFRLGPTRDRMLAVLADLYVLGLGSVPRPTLAVLSGQGPRSSAFREHLAAMRKEGLLESAGGHVTLTDEGRELAPKAGRPPTLDELHNRWMRHLPAAAARILAVLIACYPEGISREDLAEHAGQSPRSSAFRERLAELGRLGIAHSSGGRVRATALIFPKGLR